MQPRIGIFCNVFLAWISIQSVKASVEVLHPPEQIHVSYGDSHDRFVVMWSSRDLTKWQVRYWKSQTGMTMSTNCSVATLPEDHRKSAKYVYRAELQHLDAGSQYFYKIMSTDAPEVESSTFDFHTLDPSKDSSRSLRFIVYGDMGSTKSRVTVKAIEQLHERRRVDSILHVGDFAYDLHSDGGKVGDDFMKEIQPLASEIPYMTSPGNHEIPGDFQSYRTRFSSPGTEWPIPLNKQWYSFDVGLVHFISYSTEVYFTYQQNYVCEQFHWLRRDLETANKNRHKTPWIVAFGHRPMYCSNSDSDDCANTILPRWVQEGLEPLFHAFGVDMILQAHEHSYERLYPLFNGAVERFNYINPRAPVHVISGAAGSLEGTDGISILPRSWSAFQAAKASFNSYGVLEIINRTHLSFSQIEARDISTIDSFVLQQSNHGPFIVNAKCSESDNNSYCSCVLPLKNMITAILTMAMVCVLILQACGILFCLIIRLGKRTHTQCNNKVHCHIKRCCQEHYYNRLSMFEDNLQDDDNHEQCLF